MSPSDISPSSEATPPAPHPAESAEPERLYLLAKAANRDGDYRKALQLVEGALEHALENATKSKLLQQKALALARMGFTGGAFQIMEQILADYPADGEILGLMGRIHKDLAIAAATEQECRDHRVQAMSFYQRGLEDAASAYCGINAATLAIFMDQPDNARSFAEATLAAPPQRNPYYDKATRAEAQIILGNLHEAAALYREAYAVNPTAWGDIASTRKQCRLLCHKLQVKLASLEDCFPSFTVAAFAGHLVDLAGRSPRFSVEMESSVTSRVEGWLLKHSVRFGFSSAAAGSDLIFLEAAHRLGIETHVILPFPKEAFAATSILPYGNSWLNRFETALVNAKKVWVLSESAADDPSGAFEFANRMIAALAMQQSAHLDLSILGLVVWDLNPGDAAGGTSDAAAQWLAAKIGVHALHPALPEKDGPLPYSLPFPPKPFGASRVALPKGCRPVVNPVLYMHFADYQRLDEHRLHLFQQELLSTIANRVAQSSTPPVGRYGFGADYAFVFETELAAGRFALDVLERMKKTLELIPQLDIELPRLCLHHGPLQLMVNPILNQYVHEGATLMISGHLAKEGLAPGAVFATEYFTALSKLVHVRDFLFEDAGQLSCDGGKSHHRMYRLCRS